jgi:hypothetical protein
LDHFNLGEYKKFDDDGKGMQRLIDFMYSSSKILKWNFRKDSETMYTLERHNEPSLVFTSDRGTALQQEQVQLIGLEHPVIKQAIDLLTDNNFVVNINAIYGFLHKISGASLITYWKAAITTKEGATNHLILKIAIDENQKRAPWAESLIVKLPVLETSNTSPDIWENMANRNKSVFQDLIHRELLYRGIIGEGASYSVEPLAFFGIGAK